MQGDNKILISVLMCCYNGEPYLHRAFYAFKNQTWQKNYEVVFIDNGSTDNSYGLAKAFKDENPHIPVQILRLEKNDLAKATDFFYEHAIGEYVLKNDADDWLEPNAIELFVNKINETHADMIAGLYQERTENKILRKRSFSKNPTKWAVVEEQGHLIKKEIRYGRICPPSYEDFGDFYFTINSNLKTKNVAFIKSIVHNFFKYENSSFNSKYKNYSLEKMLTHTKNIIDVYKNAWNTETDCKEKNIIMYAAMKKCYENIIYSARWGITKTPEQVKKFLLQLKIEFPNYKKNPCVTLSDNGFPFRARFAVYLVYWIDRFNLWGILLRFCSK